MRSWSVRLLAIIVCLSLSVQISIASVWQPPVGSDLDWCNWSNWWPNDGPPTSADGVLVNVTEEGPAQIGPGCYASAASLIIAQYGYSAGV